MTENSRRVLLLAAAIVLAAAPLALAADAPKALGTWDVVATTPNGDMPSVLTLKMADGKVKVEYELAGMPRTVTDEKLDKDVLTMKVEYEGGVYEVEAKVDGDKMEGTWQGNGASGTLTGKRRK
jgi:hypothetical protein